MNYRVFRFLKALQDTNFTINRLAQDAKLSYSQTYNAFQDIMVELQLQSTKHVADMNEADFRAVGSAVSVDHFRFHLLDESLAFRFFDYAFTDPNPDVHQFCEAAKLSIPTLRRRIAPFKAYLAGYNLSLDTQTWAVVGDETQVRLAMLTFYQMAFRGCGWPLSEAAFQTAKQRLTVINRSDTTWFTPQPLYTKQALLVLAVQALRIHNGHPLSENARWQTLIQTVGLRLEPLVYETETFPGLTPAQLVAERDFCYFCRVHFLSLDPAVTATEKNVMAAFAVPGLAVNQFADDLLESLIDAADPSTDESAPDRHDVLRVNLHRMAVSYFVLHGNFAKRLDFLDYSPQESIMGRLPRLIKAYFAGLDTDTPAGQFAARYDDMKNELYQVIAPDFPALNDDHRLKVAVFVDSGTFVNRDLRTFLANIDFVEVLPTDPHRLPDLIITALSNRALLTHFYGPAVEHAEVVHWATEADDNDFFYLMTVLRRARHALPESKKATV